MKPYDACLQKMFGLRRFGIKLGLDVIDDILKRLGDPQQRFNTIHVAGTNGKGSVAATLASILQASGFSVGLYTSPHLVRFNERIRVDGNPIGDADVVAAYEAVEAANRSEREPTFFEFSTAMAFAHFGDRKVNWAVIETGMGGRLDATNIITPQVSIITNISLEHRDYLGKTLTAIAREKAGIIKPGVPVVTGTHQPGVLSVIRDAAERQQAPLFRRGQEFRVRRNTSGTFDFHGLRHVWTGLKPALTGGHQVDNAALALAACERLIEAGVPIEERTIRVGMEKTRWPGRLEVVSRSPLVILDGAHNLMAARNLARYLEGEMKNRRLTFVLGVLSDKPYQAMLSAMLPICSRAIITQAKIDRAIPAETLAVQARRFIDDVTVVPDVGDAVRIAIEGSAADDAVCVAGSLYVVGEAMPEIGRLKAAGLLG
ncbi:MAG: bifunctional folylpolyglutamate synthase/dihydrofolate synthase [Desulfobacterales bacterium]